MSDLDKKRDKIINKYFNSIDFSNDKNLESIALRELNISFSEEEIEAIEEDIYSKIFHASKNVLDVIKYLRKKHKLTKLTSSYLVEKTINISTLNVNLNQEYISTLTLINHNISRLQDLIEAVVKEGETSSVDPDALFVELRNWITQKANMVDKGIQKNLMHDLKNSNASSSNSLEELNRLKEQLKGL